MTRRWSISSRLIALYVGTASLLLVGCLATLYFLLVRQIEAEDRKFLVEHVEWVRLFMTEDPADTARVLSKLKDQSGHEESLHLYVRLLADAKTVVAETPGMERLLPRLAFLPPSEGRPTFASRTNPDGRRFLLVSLWLGEGSGASRQQIQLALDESADDELIAEIRRKMALILAGGVIAAAAIGGWVSRRALRPVVALANATRQVTASQLHARISLEGWPAELAGLAEGFDAMLARLDESFRRLSEFSANLSHELRTPLNNFRGEAEVVLARARSADEYRAVIESGLEEMHRLNRLIDNLLFIARAESAEIRLALEVLDAATELRAVADYYAALAEESRVAVKVSGAARLRSDAALLRRMVSNLLANALRHTPAGGQVELSAGATADGGAEIVVADNGAGIPPEHLVRVFDRFYRAEAMPPSGEPKGFGLGLAIVRSIMHLHGGEATLTSKPGAGTRVTLHFPRPSAPS